MAKRFPKLSDIGKQNKRAEGYVKNRLKDLGLNYTPNRGEYFYEEYKLKQREARAVKGATDYIPLDYTVPKVINLNRIKSLQNLVGSRLRKVLGLPKKERKRPKKPKEPKKPNKPEAPSPPTDNGHRNYDPDDYDDDDDKTDDSDRLPPPDELDEMRRYLESLKDAVRKAGAQALADEIRDKGKTNPYYFIDKRNIADAVGYVIDRIDDALSDDDMVIQVFSNAGKLEDAIDVWIRQYKGKPDHPAVIDIAAIFSGNGPVPLFYDYNEGEFGDYEE